jgi:hypothetical protein
MNFIEGFSGLKPEDRETDNIAKALRKKANLDDLNDKQGDYLVKSA